jgi:hypothetical protein
LRDMVREASTSPIQRTTPRLAPRRRGAYRSGDMKESRRVKRISVLVILTILVLGVVGGLVYLGLNPPNPVAKQVEKVLPNDKFQTH